MKSFEERYVIARQTLQATESRLNKVERELAQCRRELAEAILARDRLIAEARYGIREDALDLKYRVKRKRTRKPKSQTKTRRKTT